MLDQSFLSLNTSNIPAPSSKDAVSTASTDTSEHTIPSTESVKPIDSETAPEGQKFSDVLKETENQMQSSDQITTDGTNNDLLLSQGDHHELIAINDSLLTAGASVEFITPTVESEVLPKIELAELDDTVLDDTTQLTTVDTETISVAQTPVLNPSVLEPVQNPIRQPIDPTENSPLAALGQKTETIIKPALSPLASIPPSEGQSLAIPVELVKTPLASAVVNTPVLTLGKMQTNQPVLQQLSGIFSEQIAEEPELDFDIETLKNLSLLNSNALANQTASVNASTTKAPIEVTIPFQQAQWGSAVAEKVMWMSSHGLQEAQIQMDPPELGSLQVKVTIDNDQAHVSFVVQHANVKDALEQTAVRLREMFEAEGIDLVDVDVSDQSAEQQDSELAEQNNTETTGVDENTLETVEHTVTSLVTDTGGIDAYA